MNNSTNKSILTDNEKMFNRSVIDIAIKLVAIALIVFYSFQIIKPFVLLVIWGGILAVALSPVHSKLTLLLKGKKSLAATLIAVIGIALIAVPSVSLSSSSIDSAQHLYTEIEAGTLKIPQPNESVKEWPLIGQKTFSFWQQASTDLSKLGAQYSEQIKSISASVLTSVLGIGSGILQFIVSLIIAAVFLTKSQECHRGADLLMTRLMNEAGARTISTTVATIKSVATGVLGVAVIQSILSGIGLMMAGIPGSGLWAIVVLVLAIAQLPPILVLGPIAAYYFSVADTTPAILFLIFSIAVSMSDAFLKPLFLGRGMDIPMLVILMGAIGGMLWAGIIGLFVGAVILALAYQLMLDWLAHNTDNNAEASE
ncbi:MAG: AI-2E family transporter [Colwellia sp.]